MPARLELFFFGVTTNTTLINASMTLNDTRGVPPEQLLTNIEHVQLMLVLLRAEEVPDEERDMLAKCQLAIADHFVQNPPKLLHIDVWIFFQNHNFCLFFLNLRWWALKS